MHKEPDGKAAHIADTSSAVRNKIGLGLLAAAFAFLVGAIIVELLREEKSPADPGNLDQVARGKAVYERHCAACHGAKLEGQPNWEERYAPPRRKLRARRRGVEAADRSELRIRHVDVRI
jgi:cytochrome c5